MRSRAVSALFLGALLLDLGGMAWVFFRLRHEQGARLILHFDDLAGITSVGPLSHLLAVGILGLFVIVMNYLIALEFDVRDRFLGKLAAVATFAFALLLFLGFIAILNVN